jgi:hypothetical protein
MRLVVLMMVLSANQRAAAPRACRRALRRAVTEGSARFNQRSAQSEMAIMAGASARRQLERGVMEIGALIR